MSLNYSEEDVRQKEIIEIIIKFIVTLIGVTIGLLIYNFIYHDGYKKGYDEGYSEGTFDTHGTLTISCEQYNKLHDITSDNIKIISDCNNGGRIIVATTSPKISIDKEKSDCDAFNYSSQCKDYLNIVGVYCIDNLLYERGIVPLFDESLPYEFKCNRGLLEIHKN